MQVTSQLWVAMALVRPGNRVCLASFDKDAVECKRKAVAAEEVPADSPLLLCDVLDVAEMKHAQVRIVQWLGDNGIAGREREKLVRAIGRGMVSFLNMLKKTSGRSQGDTPCR